MSLPHGSLRAACKRYGPGRLPGADRPDLGAGYAAATAACVATVLFVGVSGAVGSAGVANSNTSAFVVFGALALPFVVPAAFVAGVATWRVLPPATPYFGLVAGLLGTVATYLVTVLLFGAVVVGSAALSLSGAALIDAALFSVGLVWVAFVLTWWLTLPLGCVSGYVYTTAAGRC